MAHPKLDMDDSDSEYDPSKIPANPPKTMSMRPVSTPQPDKQTNIVTSTPTSNGNPSDAIIHEAERDWEAIDNVCSRPMFAQTEDVKRALNLLRKWTEGADTRYGSETMSYLRRKIIGPAAEARKQELVRMLSVRAQVDGEPKSAGPQVSPYPSVMNILPPIKPRSEADALSPSITRSMQNGFQPNTNGTQPSTNGYHQNMNGSHPNGNGFHHQPPPPPAHPHHMNGSHPNTNGTNPRPPQYQPPTDRRPQQPRAPSLTIPQSHLPAPQPSLPPIHAEPSRPANSYQSPQSAQQPSYPPPSFPISRGRNWIYTPDSDLWCPICRVGPLTCMHSHRLIGRLFTRGIKYSSLEELQYTHEQLENWAYRGHPLKMEPAMTRMYSLEELAAEQKQWIADLRIILSQRPSDQPHHPPQRSTNSFQQGYTNGHARHSSTSTTRGLTSSRLEDPRHTSMNGHDPYAQSTPTSYTQPTPTSIRSPAVTYPTGPRVHDQGICRLCPRNSPCIHQRDDRRGSHLPVEQTNGVNHKRKRSTTSTIRRVKMSFRPDVGDVVSSDDDDDDDVEEDEVQGFHNTQLHQKFNQVRTIVDTMPKDQLSTAILRMCYSNSMILNWVKKELKKTGLPKEIVVTGEGSLITPTSPDSTTAKATKSPSIGCSNSSIIRCGKCEATFDTAGEAQIGDCQYHDGELAQDTQSSRVWQDDATKRMWTCCGAETSSKGCRSGKHFTTTSTKATSIGTNQTTVASLTRSTAGRQAVKHYSCSFSVEQGSLYPGQSLVKALTDAEKETERVARDNFTYSPTSRRSSNAGNTNDYQAFQDYSPSSDTLEGIPTSAFELGIDIKEPLDLGADVDRHLLHKQELKIASELQLTCAVYLTEKRRIFRAVVEAMQDGSEFGQQDAQAVCKIDSEKARSLFTVFERIGWFEPKHFMKYLNDPSGTMISSIERSLPGVNSLPYSGTDNSGRPKSAPDLAQSPIMARRASSGSASAPVVYALAKKQRSPTHLPHSSTLFQPLYAPGHLHAPRYIASGHHMDQGHNTVNLTDLPHTPPRDLIMAGSPETYQWRKNGNGKKMQVPICPYPRSWAEADSVDRELVRLKRHEGKQWEELFEWWRNKGRASLKNASCLAVRYSILKKNYESDWVREGL